MRITNISLVAVLCLFTFSLLAADAPPLYFGALEKQFADFEKDVPGFGGWHFEKDGSAVVLLKNVMASPVAIGRLETILAARPPALRGRHAARKAAVGVRPVRFAFSELAQFRQAISSNIPAGVHMIDLDEVRNVVSVAVDDEEAIGAVRATAARLGIPNAALRVRLEPPAVTRVTLHDYQRPVRGGLAIGVADGTCTVGVNGYWRPYGTSNVYPAFITNSHCTSTDMGYDGSAAYQGGSYIGSEYYDPPPMNSAPCGWGGGSMYPCRWSDTAVFLYADPSSQHGGSTIVETDSYAFRAAASSQNVIGYQSMTGQVQLNTVGDWLDKIGATSGWTYGSVTATCLHIRTSGSVAWVICQDESDVFSAGGDSGSAMFKGYSDHVDWAGILFAGTVRQGVTYSYSSPVWAVESDLPWFSRN